MIGCTSCRLYLALNLFRVTLKRQSSGVQIVLHWAAPCVEVAFVVGRGGTERFVAIASSYLKGADLVSYP